MMGRSCPMDHPTTLAGARWAKFPTAAVFKPQSFLGGTLVHPAIGIMVRYSGRNAYQFPDNLTRLWSMWEIALASHHAGDQGDDATYTTVASTCTLCGKDDFMDMPGTMIHTCALLARNKRIISL